MPTPRHTPSSSRSGALPARYTVPPLPPQIHRRLLLSIQDDGVLLRPKAGDGEQKVGVRLSWGVRGKVDQWDDEGQDEDDTVELGGILGVVRLWDGRAQLLLFPRCMLTFHSCVSLGVLAFHQTPFAAIYKPRRGHSLRR